MNLIFRFAFLKDILPAVTIVFFAVLPVVAASDSLSEITTIID